MSEKPRERVQFTLSSKDVEAFFKAKQALERKLGMSLTNAELIRHSIATQLKQLEA